MSLGGTSKDDVSNVSIVIDLWQALVKTSCIVLALSISELAN